MFAKDARLSARYEHIEARAYTLFCPLKSFKIKKAPDKWQELKKLYKLNRSLWLPVREAVSIS